MALGEVPVAIPVAVQVPVAREVTQAEPAVILAPKLAGQLAKLPISATVSDSEFLDSAMIRLVKEAAIYAPNALFAESSVQRLNLPYVRGIGGSALQPGVTTFIDGVPQLHGSSSNLNFLDVAQVDFTRGPMGTLFGRNTVGGGIHISSNLPSLTTLGGDFQTTVGNYDLWDVRGRVSGPLIQDQLGFSLAGGMTSRDGFNTRTITGDDVDSRRAQFGKAQFLWRPDEKLEVRFILAGESDRGGGYAWNSVQSLRQRPRQVQQDFSGHASRSVIMPTLQVIYHAESFDVTSTTGYVGWSTDEASDLDASSLPLVRQLNHEQMWTWTQEIRFSNPVNELVTLSDELKLGWQAGMLLFHSDYRQDLNHLFPALPIPLPRSAQTELSQWGIGSYLQGTLQWKERFSLTAGLRWDYEEKSAEIHTSSIFLVSPARRVDTDQLFSQVTPQLALSYQLGPELMSYVSFASGYKAGGFNALGPVEYDEERSQSYELGLKGRAWKNKLAFSIAAFHTDYRNLQMSQFFGAGGLAYIQNAGQATTQGLETQLTARINSRITLFGSASWLDTKFKDSSREYDASIRGHELPYAPDYSFTLGALLNQPLKSGLSLYARADIQTIGSFSYDAQNTLGQDAYTLANARVGLLQNDWFAEVFVNNAFNTQYITSAVMNYTGSGYNGQSGAPLTFGMRFGIHF
jgi:iron complex outermembrane recepter protein